MAVPIHNSQLLIQWGRCCHWNLHRCLADTIKMASLVWVCEINFYTNQTLKWMLPCQLRRTNQLTVNEFWSAALWLLAPKLTTLKQGYYYWIIQDMIVPPMIYCIGNCYKKSSGSFNIGTCLQNYVLLNFGRAVGRSLRTHQDVCPCRSTKVS